MQLLAMGIEVKADMVVIGSAIDTDAVVIQTGLVGDRAVDGEKSCTKNEFLSGKEDLSTKGFGWNTNASLTQLNELLKELSLKVAGRYGVLFITLASMSSSRSGVVCI